ncbi:hypothetical protein H4991_05415 [Campylobacter jejuni]|nr:hypothetical protein H4991_05415 [Campylobacter jejuni]
MNEVRDEFEQDMDKKKKFYFHVKTQQKPLIIEKKLDVKNQPNIKKSLENLQKK